MHNFNFTLVTRFYDNTGNFRDYFDNNISNQKTTDSQKKVVLRNAASGKTPLLPKSNQEEFV